MNARTAKLIRRHCRETGFPVRILKRLWNLIPRPQRNAARQKLMAYVTP